MGICFIYSTNIFNFNFGSQTLKLGELNIRVMGVLSLMLGISYGILLKTNSKKSFHLIIGINVIVLIYNLMTFSKITSLFFIICVILNLLITFLVTRKKLKPSKFNLNSYLPVIITLIVLAVFTLLFDSIYISNSNERDYDVPQIEIITEYIKIREDKDVNSRVLGEVHRGEIYTIISEDKESLYNWYLIETSKGIRGYIAGKSEDIDYVRKLDSNEINDPDDVNNIIVDNRTPFEKLHDTLLNKGYTTTNSSYYIYNFGYTGNEMFYAFDQSEQVYYEYSHYSGLYMLTQFYYGTNIAKFTYEYLGYTATIEWNLNTTRWNCNSNLSDWCQDYGQEYVDKNLNDVVVKFYDLMNEAGISIDDIK